MSQREHWGSRLGFVMAAAGSAIGLGSLWRFPYIVGENGGGAFVLCYIAFTLLIATPLFIAELLIGRKTQKGAVFAYQSLTKVTSNWKMVGWLNTIACFIILGFYSVVSGWCLSYILMSLTQFTQGKNPEEIRSVFTTLASSSGINIFWLFLFIALNVAIVFSGIRKGIEKWSRILMPVLLIILFALFIYSCTLPGFSKAAKFLFYPDFANLSPSGILNALGMSFFTASVGLGIILTYGSYMKKNEDIPKTSLMVSGMTLLVSIFGALMIFPIVFTFGFSPEEGPGLVFQTLPILFAKMPGQVIISTVFFALLLFTAITSSISILEMLVANFMELYNLSREKATILCASISFLIGIPCALSFSDSLFASWKSIYGMNFFDTMNYITASWFMPISGLLTVIFVGWILKKELIQSEFTSGTSWSKLFNPWFFFVKFIAPIGIILIILDQTGIINFNAIFGK
ncbi:MAG: sodium-dependent transporter [Rhabdochlamydiaceae bacterium]|nr:sodium-dependent transporter [Candidatus Amphrikana amoebophyrae]